MHGLEHTYMYTYMYTYTYMLNGMVYVKCSNGMALSMVESRWSQWLEWRHGRDAHVPACRGCNRSYTALIGRGSLGRV
jgi:hypothetical protein